MTYDEEDFSRSVTVSSVKYVDPVVGRGLERFDVAIRHRLEGGGEQGQRKSFAFRYRIQMAQGQQTK